MSLLEAGGVATLHAKRIGEFFAKFVTFAECYALEL